jgi:hypothetical protein
LLNACNCSMLDSHDELYAISPRLTIVSKNILVKKQNASIFAT